MKEAIVEQAVKTYFADQFPQFSTAQQCEVQFGTRHGIADVVLHQPIRDERGYFVAIAECKRLPLPILRAQARAQLKSYMSATNTQYGVLAVGTDPRNWEFCENKYNNWFAEINREDFERGIKNWEPVSAAALAIDGRAKHRTSHWWKRLALFLGVLFIVSIASLLLLWPDPPEPIVYITKTGRKYHTYNCNFLEHYADRKFAIYLDEAEKNYDPCGICSPHRTEKLR
ncbi:MAG: type I restriction enzyme HsdR N-terminal domain-containing protein [Candidatus Poribacteria bacterium]|nr:type I restriction enzyme HsdR N-terminal domain-containing protein [Candidatus Poribacteria bacterium]